MLPRSDPSDPPNFAQKSKTTCSNKRRSRCWSNHRLCASREARTSLAQAVTNGCWVHPSSHFTLQQLPRFLCFHHTVRFLTRAFVQRGAQQAPSPSLYTVHTAPLIMLEFHGTAISTPQLLGALLVLFTAYRVVARLSYDAKLRKLGARAPIRKTWLPLELDLAYTIVKAAIDDRMYEFWLKAFQVYSRNGCYTIETGIGERVIMTADPENIKAILATQFKEYGKGEQFHKDWEDFLGDGGHACSGN